MRLLPLLTALIVTAFLYALVFERQTLLAFAAGTDAEASQADMDKAEEAMPKIAVVVRKSLAKPVDSAVLLRGQAKAARQVDVRAETSALVISEPLRKGATVTEGQVLCELDAGTRLSSLAETKARLVEAKVRLPEAQSRLAEAQARLDEALINNRAASTLKEDGFASETRVAATTAAVESAKAAVQSAKAGVEGARSGVQAADAAIAAAEKEISRLKITAPFGGLLESDTAEIGSLLQPGALCGTIIQMNPVDLVGFVPEIDVDRITLGAPAQARLASGRNVTGVVTFLSRTADQQTRTFEVEVRVANDDLSIRDGQTAEILIGAEGSKAHLLPASAMTLNDDGILGVRLATAGTAQFQAVSLLRDTVDGVWLTGLPDEADVIVVGQEYVTDGVPIAVTYQKDTE